MERSLHAYGGAAVAVGYSLVVGLLVYRELKLADLPKIFLDSGVLATSIMFIMGAATIFAWILTYAGVPEMVTGAAEALQDPYLFLLLVNLLVLFLGMWMDPTATIVVLTPILLPIAISLGIHPVHFGVVFVYNLMIGLATPPVGYILYVASAIGDVSIERLTRVLWPFLVLHIAILLLITYAPWLVMVVPRMFGYR